MRAPSAAWTLSVMAAAAIALLSASLPPTEPLAAEPRNEPVERARPQASSAKPKVVSLDYCADQYTLALADRDQILVLSPHAQSNVSHLGPAARGIPRIRPTAEALLMLKPDLAVRQWGGGLGAGETLARYGIPVVQVGVGQDLNSIRTSVLAFGEALGQADRARRIVDDMDQKVRMLNAEQAGRKLVALYVTGSGATAGRGTLIDAMFAVAGVANHVGGAARSGWQTIDLEQIVLAPPAMFVTAFFEKRTTGSSHWAMSHHPVLARMLETRPTVELPNDLVSCPAWFILDAADAVARAAQLTSPRVDTPAVMGSAGASERSQTFLTSPAGAR